MRTMKILVVNDDSIHAPGIRELARAAAQLGEVWVVAPSEQCSAMSQKLTLRERMGLQKVEGFSEFVREAWQLGGTPVDCVKVALAVVMDEKPDLILSGINNGFNVGYDIAYSGTLGAAFEGRRNGIPAIAVSGAGDSQLPAMEPYLVDLLRELAAQDPGEGAVWNVNFPSMKNREPLGILRQRVPAPVCMYRESYVPHVLADGRVELECRGTPISDESIPVGTDAEAVRKGYISISSVRDVF